jgi:hypothetical protein
MAVSAIEPLGVEVNASGQLCALFPKNNPNEWEHLKLKHRFLAQVARCIPRPRYLDFVLFSLGKTRYRALLGESKRLFNPVQHTKPSLYFGGYSDQSGTSVSKAQ